jgi:aminoglycoside phosphotransferase (APT) family kinase protein
LLRPALQSLQHWAGRRDLAAVLVHGDYWLGNVLFNNSQQVTGIIDWERCRKTGCPGLDAIHLVMASYSVWRAQPLPAVLEQIWTQRWESRFLVDQIAGVQKLFGLSGQDLPHLAVLLWLSYIRSTVMSTGEPLREWLWQNVEHPAQSLNVCLNRMATLPPPSKSRAASSVETSQAPDLLGSSCLASYSNRLE